MSEITDEFYVPADYTETYQEFCARNNTWFKDNLKLDTDDRTTKFENAFYGLWCLYDIGSSTEDRFKLTLLNIYNQWKDYYIEMLNAYEKNYDYSLGIVQTHHAVSTPNLSTASTGTNDTKDYELPNKIAGTEYPTSKAEVATGSTINQTGTKTDDTTDTNNDRFIEMKVTYMNQIRQLYLEFANKFSDCFIHIFKGEPL